LAEERAKRKLTAILSADVKGYSRLMGQDELATVETLKRYREVISSLVLQYSGRVVDSPGDNILAEFISVVDAVECAVEIQEELHEKNAGLPEDRRMEFRIGVNLGDVIDDEGRIYGDGVNVAARVEGLADGGGICISGIAFDSVRNKLNLGYEYLGEHHVKNITEPVRVYKVLTEPEAAGKVLREGKPRPRRWPLAAVAVVLIVALGSLALWNFYFRPDMEPASEKKMAFPLPDKPSIAVLPFDNMSGDPKQEYFSDGLTEEIITALSKVPRLFVIARNSTFTYKGTPVKVNQVAEELGVRYVLEGSVRKETDRVRITAQLIDALTGHHLWAERYDRDLKGIFALQDEVTLRILQTLQVKLTAAEQYIAFRKGTDNLQAYLKMLEARESASKSNPEGYAMAGRLAEEAMALDRNYPGPYLMLSASHLMEMRFGTSESPEQSLKTAEELVQKALSLDDQLAEGHAFLGRIYLTKRQYDKAVTAGQRACDLAPNSPFVHAALGYTLLHAGRAEEAITYFKQAIRLNPFPPSWYLASLGGAYFMQGRYDDAIAAFEKGRLLAPESVFPRAGLAAAFSEQGRQEEARAEAAEVLRLDPKFSVASYVKGMLYKNKEDADRYVVALRKAGLPETSPLPLPDKPSIAVLPFVNMSGDPEQEYFSDGLTEEIITALSKSQRLFVIARESSFSYKGKSIQIPTVGRELGVRYVLEGSVRMAKNQVRITAQLIDAPTGHHLWAERYDRELSQIFAIQDDITKKIMVALQVTLTDGEQASLYGKGTDNLQAFLKCLQGREYMYRFSREGIDRARPLLNEAISLDSNYAATYRWLGGSYMLDVMLGDSKNPKESLMTAIKLAQKALSLDESFVPAYCLLAQLYAFIGKYDEGVALAERAVSINPNSADAHNYLGRMLDVVDRPGEAIPELKRGIRLNPIPPKNYLLHLAQAYNSMEKYEEAVATLRQVVDRDPNDFLAHMMLTIVYSKSSREEEARAEAAEVLRINPKFRAEKLRKMSPRKNREQVERGIEALRRAGLS